MKVFISWSGPRSKEMALALRDWLPLMLHYAEPWLSDRDISAGERWLTEVASQLDANDFGVLCLTKDNLAAPWILFEAGAVSKTVSSSAVCPYLLDIEFREIAGPLSQFQAKKTDKQPTLELVQSINKRAPEPVDAQKLEELFEVLWPKLEAKLKNIPESTAEEQEERPASEVLEELVETVRAMDNRFAALAIPLYQAVANQQPPSSLEDRLATLLAAEESAWGRRDRELLDPERVHRLFWQRRAAKEAAEQDAQPVRVLIDTDITRYNEGDIISVTPKKPTTFLVDLAAAVEVPLGHLHKTWEVMDAEGSRIVTAEELADLERYFGDSEPLLRLTGLPRSS